MNPKLRSEVVRRAAGRCEYCRIPVKFDFLPAQVDHIISEQHRGLGRKSNLALTCAHCNAHKGPNIAGIDPHTKRLARLFDPRREEWRQHFRFVGGRVVGTTVCGRITVYVLNINDPIRIAIRENLMEAGLFDQ